MTAFAKAVAHYDRGELAQAIPWFQQALREEPGDTNVMYRCTLALVSMGDYQGCADWLTELLPRVNPAETPPVIMAGFYYNLGVALESLGKWEQADRAHRSALAFDPQAILPTIEVGTQHYRRGEYEEGAMWHDRALLPAVVDLESRPARSFLKLLRGDYIGGFAEYESRWKLPQVLAKSYVPKDCWRWKGKPCDRLLVVGEQGIGDTILMSRYLPLIQERVGTVILVCHPALERLFAYNFPDVEIHTDRTTHPKCQWWVPMMSLPFVFGTTKETIPSGDRPYLSVPPVPDLWAESGNPVPWKPSKWIGWVSSGNPLFMGDKDRSAPDGAFNPLADFAKEHKIQFPNLSQEADASRFGSKDLYDTAVVISQLDLVVTVDTAIGHLAGALGVKTWLLPMTSLHWLWGLPHELTSPWYPNHTLYRRRTIDAWPAAIQRIRNDLENQTR